MSSTNIYNSVMNKNYENYVLIPYYANRFKEFHESIDKNFQLWFDNVTKKIKTTVPTNVPRNIRDNIDGNHIMEINKFIIDGIPTGRILSILCVLCRIWKVIY